MNIILLKRALRGAFAAAVSLAATANAGAQQGGLDAPAPVGAFLNGAFPDQTPGASGDWELVNAFPNLTFIDPVQMLPVPGTNELMVAEKAGLISVFTNDETTTAKTTLIDFRAQVESSHDSGFMGIAFHPQFGEIGSPNRDFIYIYYRFTPNPAEKNLAYCRLSRVTWVLGSNTIDPASEFVMINQYDRHNWHNGGGIFFGNDDFLYLSIGDEGGANDQYNTGQKMDAGLLAGVLRIDVDQQGGGISHAVRRQPQNPATPPSGWPNSYSQGYFIPNDNPWLDAGGGNLEEFWAIGTRSPHRMTIDRPTGDIYLGDVGQSTREEVSLVVKSANLQWPYREGDASGPKAKPSPLIGVDQPPLHDYPRADGGCVCGGYVYRGQTHAASLGGKYIFGDHSSGRIWALSRDGGNVTRELLLNLQRHGTGPKNGLSGFGIDADNEIYVLSLFGTDLDGGIIYKLARTGANIPEPPLTLSQTGAFSDLANLSPSSGLIPYDVNTPLWTDGADKQRWIAVPNDGSHDTLAEQIIFSQTGNWNFPQGTVIVKQFDLLGRRVETRFLCHGADGNWYGVTYRWRADQSDADLLFDRQQDTLDIGGDQHQWTFPSRSDCMQCHTGSSGRVLGLRTQQLNREQLYPPTGRTANQLLTFNRIGLFSSPIDEGAIPSFLTSAALDDSSASLEQRARSYLDSNCAHCHNPTEGIRAFDFRLATPLNLSGVINAPVQNNFGIAGAKEVVPSDPSKSMAHVRQNTTDEGMMMPPLGRHTTDTEAVSVIADWIQSLNPNDYPQPGLSFEYYEGIWDFLPDFDSLTPIATGEAANFDISARLRDNEFAFRFTGKISIAAAGDFTFYTSSDDGSRLWIDGQLVVDNDGLHATQERAGTISLTGGQHDIVVAMFEKGGAEVLTVSYEGPGLAKQIIPGGVLSLPVPNGVPDLQPIADQEANEGDSISLTAAAIDPDGDALTYSASGLPSGLVIDPASGLISGVLPYDSAGTHNVTVTASDGAGSDSEVFLWTVNNVNRAPTVSSPGNQTDSESAPVNLVVAASDADGDPLSFSATGLPSGLAIDAANGTISGTLPYDSAGVYNVDIIASDGADSGVAALIWTVTNLNRVPDVTNPGDQNSNENAAVSLAIAASDPDGDVMNFSATGLPDGITIDSASGQISGTLSFASAGSHAVVVSASDGADSGSTAFTWTVANVNRPPSMVSPGNQTGAEGNPVSLAITATDPDGDTLAYSASGLPMGLGINASTGLISGASSYASAGAYNVTVSVSDGSESDTINFSWTISNVNRSPIVTSPGGQNSMESDSINLALAASDPDGDSLTFSAIDLPTGLAIDPATGIIAGTLSFDSSGSYNVTISASDGAETASAAFVWTVTEFNRAPVVTNPGDQMGDENEAATLAISAADADGDTLAFSATGLPDGLGIDNGTGLISGTLSFASAGTHNVTITAADSVSAGQTSFTWTVSNVNRAPQITNPGNRSNDEGEAVNLAIVATDADGEPLTYSAAGLPAGLAIGPTTGLISGSPSYASSGSYSVTVTATDGSDLDSAALVWTVNDVNRSPQLTDPGDQNSTEGEAVTLALSAVDPDGDSLSFAATGLPDGLAIDSGTGSISGLPTSGASTVTLTVDDGKGGSDSTTISWTISPSITTLVNASFDTDSGGFSYIDDAFRSSAAPGYANGNWVANGFAGGGLRVRLGEINNDDIFGMSGAWRRNITLATPTTLTLSFRYNLSQASDYEADEFAQALAGIDGTLLGDEGSDYLTQITGNGNGGSVQSSGWRLVEFDLGTQSAGPHLITIGAYNNKKTYNDEWTEVLIDDVVITAESVVNHAPALTHPGDQSDAEGSAVNLSLIAVDSDGDSLTFSASGLPDGLSINSGTGLISGALSYSSAGSHAVTATVSDGIDQNSAAFIWTVANVNRAPSIINPGGQTNSINSVVNLPIGANDPDGNPLNFAAAGLPPGLSIDGSTGLISGTPTADGSYSVSLTVSDGFGGNDSAIFNWSVTDISIGLTTRVLTGLRSDTTTTILLDRSYDSLVAAIALNYDVGSPPLVARMDNVQSNRFDLNLVRLDGSSAPATGISAHIIAVEEGAYTLAEHGVKMEAVKFTSTVTDEASANWFGQSKNYLNSYTRPVVLGQVMSSNDLRWSQFWASNGSRGNPPNASSLYVGKHVAEDPAIVRADETVGYIVIEQGSGTIEGVEYEAALGADIVRGPTNAPPYSYNLSGGLSSAEVAIVSSAAIDGNNGGWPILYGATPLTTASLQLAYDEDQLKDTERYHTTEQVAYLVLGSPPGQSGGVGAPSIPNSSATPPALGDIHFVIPGAGNTLAAGEIGIAISIGSGRAGDSYRLLTSEDLVNWRDVTDQSRELEAEDAPGSTTMTWGIERSHSPRAFYRVELRSDTQ